MDYEKRMQWLSGQIVEMATQCALERDAFLYRKDKQAAAVAEAQREILMEVWSAFSEATSEEKNDSEF